jgi:hypothetical protein
MSIPSRYRVGKNGRKRSESAPLQPYVNDRAYVASSFLSVAIRAGLRSALGGASKERAELAQTPIPLEARVSGVPCGANGEELLRRLFEPLGYDVESEGALVDEDFPLGRGANARFGASPNDSFERFAGAFVCSDSGSGRRETLFRGRR